MRMKLFLIFLFVGVCELVSAEMRMRQMVEDDKSQYEVRGDRGEMAHKFGVEVVPNSQFHHTTTDEDGVRLGCYGHIQGGKKYSTMYVADTRGYRIVPGQGLIPVYPEYDTERKASFVDQFDVNEELSQNIRHFFPDACQQSDLSAQGSQLVPQRSEQQVYPTSRPVYTNRQPPSDSRNSRNRNLDPTSHSTPPPISQVDYEPPTENTFVETPTEPPTSPEKTVIQPEPETTSRPYPVYVRERDPRYMNPSSPSQNQQIREESQNIEVIALPPKCDTSVKLYYFNTFVRPDVCFKENCETLAIHLPIGTIHQNVLDLLSDVEVLEKVLELLKKKEDRLSEIRARE